jgi:starvation-inducible DNA-binding protein
MASEVLNAKSPEVNIESGIERKDREQLAQKLSKSLADTYTLYLKTQGFHWNVAGPMFYSLHKMTEEQYQDLFEAVDEIAERIRAIGFPAPASYTQFSELTDIKESTSVPTAEEMVQQLAQDNETCARHMRAAALEADKVDDIFTNDMLTARIGQHEENTWMLRALLA